MPRYSMDFSLVFSVRTDNSDPKAITGAEVLAALRERVAEMEANGPETAISDVWPPELFDGESGDYSKLAGNPSVWVPLDEPRYTPPASDALAGAARLALDALSIPRRAKVADAHAALTEALRAASEKESNNGNHPRR